ncbi:hypothetical protein D1627_14265 [Pontibacter oryzae]|uniref:Uncharacterized protein n=2 Tax=Pontibacter oryzae TaxID=2304593 RepID=A0A399S118_9BACT|nr:hypothetical protein D1627_14265 [Pontibacter oryzae]
MPTYVGELTTNVGTGYGEYRTVGTDALEIEQPKVLGSTYLNEEWAKGSLFITLNRLLETDYLKYDLENHQFLIKTGDSQEESLDNIKVINSSTVNAFSLKTPQKPDRFFINSTNAGFIIDGQSANGFLEVLINDDTMSLYRKTEAEILHASYNVALNAGDKQDRIIKKVTYYLRKLDHPELLEVSKRKKKNLYHFSSKGKIIDDFIKANRIDFSSPTDLVKLVSYYNSL